MLKKLWTEVCNIAQEAADLSQRTRGAKAKWLSEEALQIAKERIEMKSKGERKRCIQLNTDFQNTAQRDKKAFFNE